MNIHKIEIGKAKKVNKGNIGGALLWCVLKNIIIPIGIDQAYIITKINQWLYKLNRKNANALEKNKNTHALHLAHVY